MWIRHVPRALRAHRAVLPLLLCAGVALAASSCERSKIVNYGEARKRMVEREIVGRGIDDQRVINAMIKVPRHLFIPEEHMHYSYYNLPVPIGYGQTISSPFIVALMTQELEIKSTDRVLEVGTGSGYQAAILAELAKEVYTVEIIEPLAKAAEKRLKELKYDNVRVVLGDGFWGLKDYSPYDRIIVTCAPEEIPDPLIEQLGDGGIMIIPVGPAGFQYLIKVRKEGDDITIDRVTPVSFVPLTGEHGDAQDEGQD
jgi:protein-L-isoaspartate(D-aspartate) O-methyltransferase